MGRAPSLNLSSSAFLEGILKLGRRGVEVTRPTLYCRTLIGIGLFQKNNSVDHRKGLSQGVVL
jgi:hypothetical protein